MSNRILHSCAAVISDLHIGSPENPRLEDFNRDNDFRWLLQKMIPARAAGRPVTLVINGDFIDFPQILPALGKNCPAERLGTTEPESLQRVAEAIKGHPGVFAALGEFLAGGNQVLLLPGNHDIDLHFPTVLGAVRAAVGSPAAPAFDLVTQGFIEEQRVYIEHGNQYSYDNWFAHWSEPILDTPGGVRRIERPWGTMFMDLVYNAIEDLYPFVNKVHPPVLLALIVLRLVWEDPEVSTNAIARLVKFFVVHDKRMLWGHLLREEEATAQIAAGDEPGLRTITRADIEATVQELGMTMETERSQAVIDNVAASTGAADKQVDEPAEVAAEEDQPVEGLLGRTDKRGLTRRARDLLGSGTVDVVVFGHTHDAEDEKRDLSRGTCRVLNTGGWIPQIVIAPRTVPSRAQLVAAPRQHDLRYAWLELGARRPTGSLEQLR